MHDDAKVFSFCMVLVAGLASLMMFYACGTPERVCMTTIEKSRVLECAAFTGEVD